MLIQKTAPVLNGPKAYIPVGKSRFVIVDPENYNWLKKFKWRLIRSQKKTYAARRVYTKSKVIYIRMHREIAKTPKGMDCHHENLNPHDNRKCNLSNKTPLEHKRIHNRLRLIKKNAGTPP